MKFRKTYDWLGLLGGDGVLKLGRAYVERDRPAEMESDS
jgi:hypothetical protein